MGLTSVLNTANSGLQVATSGLDVVARNIANADSPGYSRKTQGQTNALYGGIGVGVEATGVTRQVNQFLQAQLRTETASFAKYDVLNDFYQRIDQLLGNPGDPNALDSVINEFTQSIQALTTSPESFAVREQVVNDAEFLAQTLNRLSGDLDTMRQSAENSLSDAVDEINNALLGLHDINSQIALSTQRGIASADLLDERDKLIDRLSEFVSIRVNELPDARVAIFTKDGNTLLEGSPVSLVFEPPVDIIAQLAGAGAILNPDAAAAFSTGAIGADTAPRVLEGGAIGGATSLDGGGPGITAADDITIEIDGTTYTIDFVVGGGHDFTGATNTLTFDLGDAADTLADLAGGLDGFFDLANAGTHAGLGVAVGAGTGLEFTLDATIEAIRLQDAGGTGLAKLQAETLGSGPSAADRVIALNTTLEDLVANSRTLQVDLGAGTLGTLTFGTGVGEVNSRADLVAQLDALVGIDATLNGNAIDIATTDPNNHEDAITFTASDASVITALGLGGGAVFVQPASNLLSQGFSAGETLTIQVGSNPALIVTFGTNDGMGEVSTLAELNTALAGLTGGAASVGAKGNLRVTADSNLDAFVLGGTATHTLLGTQAGTYNPTQPLPSPFSSTIKIVNDNGFNFDLIRSGNFDAGRIGALIELRDGIVVEAQAQLDELAHGLALALSNKDVAGAAVTVGLQDGFEVDTTGMLSGNEITLTYTQTPPGTPKTVTIVRVDDASALPLPNDLTANPNDTVLGVDFSGGLAAAAAAIDAALGPDITVSVPSGNILRFLDDGAAATIDIDALGASVTPTSLQDDGFSIPLFVDSGNSPTIYSASLEGGSQKSGFASRISVNAGIIADNELLVRHTSSPLTPIGDSDRPLDLMARLDDRVLSFSPGTGIGAASNPFTGTVTDFAQRIIAFQTGEAQNIAREKGTRDLVLSSLQDRFQGDIAVDIDTELSQLINLENSFAANARVIQVAAELMQLLYEL